MYHLSQTEQAVQTSYMMTLGNWNDTGQYRRREGRAKSAAGRTQSEPVQKKSALETLTNEIALSAYLSRQYGNENVKPLFTEPANRQASGSFGPLSAQGQNGENHDH